MVLSWSFFLIFTAFCTAQSFAAPLLGDLGSISLTVLYVFFSLGGFIAPWAVRKLTARKSLLAASLTYGTFVASFMSVL